MIRILRRMVANFITNNKDLSLNGITILQTITQDYAVVDEYITDVVLKNSEDARAPITSVVPLVLRINLDILILDGKDNVSVAVSFNNYRLFCLLKNTVQSIMMSIIILMIHLIYMTKQFQFVLKWAITTFYIPTK